MTQNRTNRLTEIRHSSNSRDDRPSKKNFLKRGRPATGKRSNPNWVGRTFYIQKKTDLDIERELFHLKCSGIDIDKSQLVNALLIAWSHYRNSNTPHLMLPEPLNSKDIS